MITLRRMTLGAGYKYLISSVAVGDGAAEMGSSLTRYYAESGTPPGVFLGAGLAGLDGGNGVEKGSQVTHEHLWNMLGICADPVTGLQVSGRTPNKPAASLAQRVEAAMATLDPALDDQQRAAKRAEIEAAERVRRSKKQPPVAGFDLTFSPVKSVSTAWACADEGTKAVIYECHRRAIDYVIGYAEREVFHSRSGTNGVVQEDIEGVVAASFTHWDSRAGDPQLHDHVVVMNRAKSTSDGAWRTLDSRGIYKSLVALSEMHQGVLSDYLTEALGIGWDGRKRAHSDTLTWEIDGVPAALMAEFSTRNAATEAAKDEMIRQFAAARGRQPTRNEVLEIRRRAAVETRPDKQNRALSEMTADWLVRAQRFVGEPVAFVSTLRDRNDLPSLRADDLTDDILADAAAVAVGTVAEKRSTFSRANVMAEVHRKLHGVRFAAPEDREIVAGRTVDMALAQSLMVTPPELHHTPSRYRRADGSSMFRAKGHEIFTNQAILDAETRLLDAGQRREFPVVSVATVAAISEHALPGKDYQMSVDQALAVEQVATSGRAVEVLVGAAGTGKSTTMAGLRAAWEADHGTGSVIGLAPSAAAADVLADEVGLDTENTAKWLHEHERNPTRLAKLAELRSTLADANHWAHPAVEHEIVRVEAELDRWTFKAGQLVIVDEASLAGTFALDRLVAAAGASGAKIVLVGDPAQLSAVDAGGAFRLLVNARRRDGLVPQLTDVRRFVHGWEKVASTELRIGDDSALDSYENEGRISGGDRDTMLDQLYSAWRADAEAGKSSLMIAADSGTVNELNRRAREDRISAGEVDEQGLDVAGGIAGVGDRVVTRENNRMLTTGRSAVKNGDRWVVTATNTDGSMAVRRANGSSPQVVLPADYVRDHVELGYATTAHRAQGQTVDTAHAMVTATTQREVLYVAATRGRQSNRLYVDTMYDPDPQTAHDGAPEPQSAGQVLAAVLRNEGADVAAHEMIRRAHDQAEGIVNLSAEYLTLSRTATSDCLDSLLDQSGLTEPQLVEMRSSEAYGPLLAAMRDAEARHLDLAKTLPLLVTGRTLSDAEDLASVLHGRVDRWVRSSGSRRTAQADLVVGLFPRPQGITDPDMLKALAERDQAMQRRARNQAEIAVEHRHPWAAKMGPPPVDPARREQWWQAVTTVAAYRERWTLTDPRVLDGRAATKTVEQLGHWERAQVAASRALALSRSDRPTTVVTPEINHVAGPKMTHGREL